MRRLRAWFLSTVLACTAISLCAMSVAEPTFDELVVEATAIVRATVVSTEPVISTLPDGRRIVKTRVSWKVERHLKGQPEQTLVLEFLGGESGLVSTTVPGMPQFKEGDTDYLFIAKNRNAVCPLIAGEYGRFGVRIDPATGARTVPKATPVLRIPTSAPSALAASVKPPSQDEFDAAILSRVSGKAP